MIIGSWLRGSIVVADLGLSRAVYDNYRCEATPHYHIIFANFDYLLGKTALHIFTSWDRLLHLFFPLRKTILQHELLPNLLFN
jgi:hypothetical protein